jgi:hypothetical protein
MTSHLLKGQVQALTNLVLAYLRGAKPDDAFKHAKKLYKMAKDDARTMEIYSHVRTITRRCGKEAVVI